MKAHAIHKDVTPAMLVGRVLCHDVRDAVRKVAAHKGDVIDLWASVNSMSLREAAIDLVRTFYLEPAPEQRRGHG